MGKKPWTLAVVAVVAVLTVGACTPTATTSPTTPATTTPATTTPATTEPSVEPTAAPPAAAVPKVPTGYAELDQALGSDKPFAGKSVNIQTQWVGGEGVNFAAALADFGAATGITFKIDSIASSHETILRTRIEGGTPPDLAVLAQPTAVVAYGKDGKLVDVAGFMDAKKLGDEHPATIGPVSDGGHVWGIPYKADVKSTVWYPIKAFAAKGYAVPTTWDELIALSDKIKADGSHPWCASAGGPGTATGWQITDWVEEVVLKTQGLDYYNKWITHEVKFTDPGIKAAFDRVAQILFTDGYVDGGGTAIVNIDQKTPMDPMFNDDTANPGCWMQKIPTWYGPDFFPDQRTSGQPSKYIIGEDIGIFAFPTIDPAFKGAEGSGDTVIMMNDRPEVRAVAEFLATPEGIQNWIRAGSAISSNQTTPAEWYAGAYKLSVAADIVANADFIGFDASDLMPASVGAGTFWTQTVDWANNNGSNTDAVLQAIDDSWPSK
ncbi:MAG: carbohydrate ABC transporter substrate-binding protein [Chloroflexi bacterium]|nr:carbohydrate ABC transporter substrate-binding protein [Chloroflexota bacterium]